MTSGHLGQNRVPVAVRAWALVTVCAVCWAQPAASGGSGTLQGHVRDTTGRPIANATISLTLSSLQPASGTQPLAPPIETTHTDFEGAYTFTALRAGSYTLHGERKGSGEANFAPVMVVDKETKIIDLALGLTKTSQKPGVQAPEFYDEPQFTVAGVTQSTNSGGHGSDTVLRTTEALAKATVLLGKEPAGSSADSTSAATETSLRTAVGHQPASYETNWRLGKFLADNDKAAEATPYLERASQLNARDAALHHLLGDTEEKLGDPLRAVREYQSAAELDPTETNLFDWGTELLAHRALEPATEVFTKGNRLFPRSGRMLVALGVAWYARGSYDQATRCLVTASDLAPENPTPYLFLGKMQGVEENPSEASLERLARFAELHPDNAIANYYYAIGLWKQLTGSGSAVSESVTRIESLLREAVRLDPKLAAAYLQMGILYSQRGDFPQAISAYQEAIRVAPEEAGAQLDDTVGGAHYRLAQAYLRTGDKIKAQEQLQLHIQLSKKTKEDSERTRREVQEFVISQRNQTSDSAPQN